MAGETVTRGHGMLEGWLAERRARMAERLIPEGARSGAVLDLGCGSSPLFLSRTRFARRVGVDREAGKLAGRFPDVELVSWDLNDGGALPFGDNEFDVVTMLAVFEHIRGDRLAGLLNEAHRVLKGGGVVVMTTPAGWTKGILWAMSRTGLVSREEIDEHEDHYSRQAIRAVFEGTRFGAGAVRLGSFEMGMNTWAVAGKRQEEPQRHGDTG